MSSSQHLPADPDPRPAEQVLGRQGAIAWPGPVGAPWPGPDWQRAHDAALVLGVLAVVTGVLGVVLGPIALVQANRARSIGPDAGAARVTAWVGIGLGALFLLGMAAYLAMFGLLFVEMFRSLDDMSGYGGVPAVVVPFL